MKAQLTTIGFFAAALFAASAAPPSDQANALADKLGTMYEAAFEKGDAKAIASLFTEDAQYTLDDGAVISGRKEIQARAGDYFESSKSRSLDLAVGSARFLADNVLIEKGSASTTTDRDQPETSQYTVTYAKVGERWLIAELVEAFEPDEANPGDEALSTLGWMIGNWKAETEGADATMETSWILEGKFISRTTRINRREGDSFVAVEVIGYDPVQGKIRSWTFDNEGGFGTGAWNQDGNKWLVRSMATGPDGGSSSSDHILTVTSADRFGLESTNRVLDGEVLPNRDRIDIVRQPETSKEK
jgi:uncharacterized protein (TIGR02246 family)